MQLQIKTTPDKYFRQLIEVFSFMEPYKQMASRERDILAKILYYNWSLRSLPTRERHSRILSSEYKEKIRMELDISKPNLENYLSKLRIHGVLTYSSIVPKYEIFPMKKVIFNFEHDVH